MITKFYVFCSKNGLDSNCIKKNFFKKDFLIIFIKDNDIDGRNYL